MDDKEIENLVNTSPNYDILLTDIDENELILIGNQEDKPHLCEGTFSPAPFPIGGIIYGVNVRFMIRLPVKLAKNQNSQCLFIYFLVDTGSPQSYISMKTMETLLGIGNVTDNKINLSIIDPNSRIVCWKSEGKFETINLLGSIALQALDVSIIVNWKNSVFQLDRLA